MREPSLQMILLVSAFSITACGSAGSSGLPVGSGGAESTVGGSSTSTETGGTGQATGGTTSNGGSVTGGAPATSTTGTTSTSAKKFVGNITTTYSASCDYNGMTYSHYWDQITPENAGKWGSVQSSASAAFNWSTLDAIYKYTENAKIIFKQHNFVWGSQQPSGTITQANVENWIKSFCARYPNTKLIDVVNEPPPHTTPGYTAALGGGEGGSYPWITKAFKLARQYCGTAVLILNDYNNIEYGDQETHFISIVADIKKNGAPIDAVGAQAHDANKLSATTLQANLDTMNSQTGLPVYITEYDVSNTSDSGQLATYQAQFPIFYNTDYIRGITIWGWIVGQTWSQAPNSGLVSGKTPRPAMTWLMGQLGRPVPPN